MAVALWEIDIECGFHRSPLLGNGAVRPHIHTCCDEELVQQRAVLQLGVRCDQQEPVVWLLQQIPILNRQEFISVLADPLNETTEGCKHRRGASQPRLRLELVLCGQVLHDLVHVVLIPSKPSCIPHDRMNALLPQKVLNGLGKRLFQALPMAHLDPRPRTIHDRGDLQAELVLALHDGSFAPVVLTVDTLHGAPSPQVVDITGLRGPIITIELQEAQGARGLMRGCCGWLRYLLCGCLLLPMRNDTVELGRGEDIVLRFLARA
mmetsp:Transcript_11320/g.28446  ORF Transcript_11320/g.28446 Transcript_11320/m.28446 type:complete len:264 (-) Transcript_11320:180-971(-)